MTAQAPENKPTDPVTAFRQQVEDNVTRYGADLEMQQFTRQWLHRALTYGYNYNFRWLGVPIIQWTADTVGLQEMIWSVKPDLVIETGIAHGGSLMLSASILAMLDYADAVEQGTVLDPKAPKRKVLGIDIDIRAHNKALIEAHPMASRIEMIQGSSIDAAVIDQVQKRAAKASRVLVCLDSNHTHDHVLAELEAYAPLTSVGSYCVVMDTGIEDLPPELYANRPWSKGNNPKTAMRAYLSRHPEFEIDRMMEWRLGVTAAEEGFLKRTR